jgi:MscS family membrane protein
MPLRCILAILIHVFVVYKLRMPLLYRFYYSRFVGGILAACIVWLLSRIVDLGFERVVNRTRIQHRGGESILIVMQRLTRIVMLIIAVIICLALFGVNVKTALAGFGIGGLAVALAAQRSLENVIGGVSLLMDKAVSVGDFCLIGDQQGTVEDIGLRSLKLRTLDQDLLVIPNGSLAQMQFANRSSRPKLLINESFSLRIETQTTQLRFVLDRVQSLLDENPSIESGSSRVRVKSLAGAAFDVELFAYVKTGNWVEFTAIRHNIMLKIADIVEASGTRFAAPARLNYQSSDAEAHVHKADATVRPGTEPRASDSFRLSTGTE